MVTHPIHQVTKLTVVVFLEKYPLNLDLLTNPGEGVEKLFSSKKIAALCFVKNVCSGT